MLKRILGMLWGLALLTCAVGASARPAASENLFYMTGDLASFESFKAHAAQISIVVPAAYRIDQYGTVYGGVDPRVSQIAASNHVMVMPIVASFDQKAIHALLDDKQAMARAIAIMLHDAEQYHYYGWQFDLENIQVGDGAAYAGFYRDTAKALHAHGFKVSMAVVKSEAPVPAPDDTGYSRYLYENWWGAFDLKQLAGIGDFISFMSYDQNTAQTPPGPVAGIPWMQRMADYIVRSGIDPRRVSFGIPTYSDYWYATWDGSSTPHSTRREIAYREVQDLLDRYRPKLRWMAQAGVNYAYWPGPDGVYRWLFVEDARSFASKLELVRRYHFRGFSAWVLGDEDPAIWDVVKRETQAVHYRGGVRR
jgi:spore germination protein YaaH